MYKLLLVSDKEEIRSLYRRYAEWNTLGFEQPDVAENAQQGIDLLSHRRYDAISSLLSVSEGKKFFAYLSRRPEMLGMETARDEEHLRREISTARRALSTRDASRQSKQVDDYTKVLQGEFFCDLLRGAAFDCTKIDERMQSLKLDALDAARPVVTSSFVLLIINPHHMRLLAAPREEMSKEEAYDRMMAHLASCQANLEQYFELTLTIKRVVPYDNLYALSRENAARTAH